MLTDLKLTETVYGLGAGIFFVGYVFFELPSNIIMYRIGARVWIACIMIVWGVISACTMFVSNATTFYIFRFFLGVAEAGFIPAVLFYLTHWFPGERRAKVMGLFFTAIPAAGIVGGPLSGWILHSLNGFSGTHGWQWLFLLEGLPSVILGFVVFFYVDDYVSTAAWLTDEQKQFVAERMQRETSNKSLHSLRHGMTHKTVWLLSVTYFFFTMGLYGVSFWLPSLIKASGVNSILNVGFLTAAPYLAAAASMVLIGRSSDKHRERRWHLIIPGVVGAFGLILSVRSAHNPLVAIAALTVATTGILTTISQFWTLPPAILGGAAAAVGIAIINSVGGVAGFISPYLLGWTKDILGSTDRAVELIALSLLLGGAFVLRLPRRL
jgi:MFS family permease